MNGSGIGSVGGCCVEDSGAGRRGESDGNDGGDLRRGCVQDRGMAAGPPRRNGSLQGREEVRVGSSKSRMGGGHWRILSGAHDFRMFSF